MFTPIPISKQTCPEPKSHAVLERERFERAALSAARRRRKAWRMRVIRAVLRVFRRPAPERCEHQCRPAEA